MQLNWGVIIPLLVCLLSSPSNGSPIRCPDHKKDDIINNRIAPEECCSYGICLNDVVVAMSVAGALEMKPSALQYPDPRVPKAESQIWQFIEQLRRLA